MDLPLSSASCSQALINPSHQRIAYTNIELTMDHSSMDPSTTDPSTMAMDMMVPWFHFTGGDHLFFESWRPASPGAIAGACIGLVLLALFDRWFAATRAVLEAHWRHRYISTLLTLPNTQYHNRGLALSLRPQLRYGKVSPTPSNHTSEKSFDLNSDVKGKPQQVSSNRQANPTRSILPFIPSHDVPRGIMHSIQALLGFLLMLAVMYVSYIFLTGCSLTSTFRTFNAAYIISIILGLGIGEVIFGRMGNGRGAAH